MRVTKDDGTTTNTYINKYYEEEDNGTNTIERAFIHAGALKLATVEDDGSTNAAYFHHTDHLSGANVTTDAVGGVLELADYFPYGGVRIEDKAAGHQNDYLYTGKERDEQTSLYYYGARYYDSEVGRFTSQDPWAGDLEDPQSFNKYSYARNNPMKYVDPTGKEYDDAIQFFREARQAVNRAGDWITFGVFSSTFDNVETQANQVAAEGANVQNVTGLVVNTLGESAKLTGAALLTGITAGGAGQVAKPAATAVKDKVVQAATWVGQKVAQQVGDWIGGGRSSQTQRPNGVPENWIQKPSAKNDGTIFQNPQNPHESVRIMPGNPRSPNPAQQNPYVVQMRNGNAIDVQGNPINANSPEAHIPQENFQFHP